MAKPTLDRVLSCPTLPSLPAVALQVLELTKDPRVSIARIAQTVQNDPALASKVLRTVNSSYYALSTPCPNIGRAMSLLGLNTVKSIVLSFSLVDTTSKLGLDGAFDLESYWRRAVYSAAAARAIAQHTRACDPDEAFVGALLQDIGMLACFTALRGEYAAVIAKVGEDHDESAGVERATLGFDHAGVGGQLAERWRLPEQLVEAVAHHHAAEHASGPHARMVRTVALGGMVASALTVARPQSKLGAFIVSARRWFEVDSATSKSLVESTAAGAAELSKLLDISTGRRPDVGSILAEAHERMLETQEEIAAESAALRRDNEELARRANTDGLTGLHNRAFFDRELREQLAKTRAARHPITLIFLDADKFKGVNDTHGHQAGDAVLIETARRLRDAIGRVGTLCRYGGEEFVAILPQIDLEKGKRIAELLRRAIERSPFDLAHYDLPGIVLPRTISLGVATSDPANASGSWTPEHLTKLADEAVYAAKTAGRNCVRWADPGAPSPEKAAAPAPADLAPTVAVVDPDPFARRLIAGALLTRFRVTATPTLAPDESASLVFIDAALLLAGLPRRPAKFVAMTSDADPAMRAACEAAGALCVLDKLEFAQRPGETVERFRAMLIPGVSPPRAQAA
ncbi:MAG: GGDEF domain-containing protein [Planctomycetota bacterium]|nr:GGDEF domain-containing protein [Planctomycetota bacterium]